MMKIERGNIKTITQVVERIKHLEEIKEEYKRHKQWEKYRQIKIRLAELYGVLGVH